jgi:hypothetical protein
MNVTLYNPHAEQAKIHEAINKGTQKYYVLNIGRQFGKTMLAMNQLFYWMFNEKGCKCAWVSPIYKQSKKVFDDMVNAFADSDLIHKNASELTITIGRSTLQFFSAERYDNIRGFTFDYLVCDEFAFMDEAAWTEVLRATVLVKGKKVLLISTPKGKNHFYQVYNLQTENPQYRSFTMTSYHNPLINPTEIDDARSTLPDHVFRQEYLAEFLDGGASVFGELNINEAPENLYRHYAGLDVGRADDYTVLAIYNEKGQMVFIERWRQMEWTNIVQQAVKHLNRFKPQLLVEVNGVGDPIFDLVRKAYKFGRVEPFVTTSKSKQEIIEDLIIANSDGKVSFLNEDWLINELKMLTWEYNPKSRSVRYAAPAGFHDDGVMGSAIGYHAFKSLKQAAAVKFT